MKCLRPILLVSLLTLVCAGVRSVPRQSTGANPKEKESKFIKPEIIQGCYELGALNWKPDLQLDKDEAAFIIPPERIELLAKRGTEGREKNGYLVRPASGVTQSVHRSTYWMPTGPNTIEVVFTTGTSGLSMKLRVEGETLKGKAKSHWDFLRRSQTAQLISRKIDCGWRKLDAGPFRFWLRPVGNFTSYRALIPLLASLRVTAWCSHLILADTQVATSKRPKNRNMLSPMSQPVGIRQK
jgi:hypothetical protein